ncbi:MAG: glycosyl hydrolase, partial [Verrucomicrobiae bacterium]
MNKLSSLTIAVLLLTPLAALPAAVPATSGLESRFLQPPLEDRTAVFWTWSNATDKPAITHDLEAMARVGIGRAVLSMTFAHSATLTNGTGMVFLSPQFLERFRFALDEAARLGIKITGIPGNGWYQGGPWVTPEMGAQMLVWSEKKFHGPAQISEKLPLPDQHRSGGRARIAREATTHLQPVATLAFRKNAAGKLLADSMVNLTSATQPDGTLAWAAPAGDWVIFRLGHVPTMVRMKQDSPGYGGLQIDHLSRAIMTRYLAEVAEPLLKAAGPHVGKTLDRLHEDSMELGHYDWTPDMPGQFQRRRGYDLVPLLPLLAGASFADGPAAERVETDFEATVEELLIDEHFGAFRDFCHQRGLTVVAEAGETRSGIATKGASVDHVMDEFWTHRGKDSDFPVCFNRNEVFAAHVYGQNRNTAEAFTSPQHWLETPAQLKTLANEVYAQGLNHLTIHGFSSSRINTPPPGDVYFAGTHYNP